MPGKSESKQSPGHDIIVVGGSAGATEAMGELLRQLPATLPAAILFIYHMPPTSTGWLHRILGNDSALQVKLAEDGEPVCNGVVYVARPDLHMILEKNAVYLRRGPKENRWRPAVDPLFRSAAIAYGSRVIGVVLTGMLDDGTSGIAAIKHSGGITVAQDPNDAAHPQMPQSAIDNVGVDYRVPVREMGKLLERLVVEPPGESPPPSKEILEETRIASQGVSDTEPAYSHQRSLFTCPDCGGPLYVVEGESPVSPKGNLRCLVGHGWSEESLLSNTDEVLETTLWAAVRLFRQRANLLKSRIEREQEMGRNRAADYYQLEYEKAANHARRLQDLIVSPSAEELEEQNSIVGRRKKSGGS